MKRQQLVELIRQRKSFLCIGLDTDPERLPAHVRDSEESVLTFNKAIIDATRDLCVAYKPNTAFYEALGARGWRILEETVAYIGSEHFIIADAKRGDIGNTSRRYAKAFFEGIGVDAVTVAPYMGEDSVTPFLGFPGKWVILLALTSNPGSADFQFLDTEGSQKLFERVLHTSRAWSSPEELMYVVGATHPERFEEIRKVVPDHFLLVPGVGAQGGSLSEVCKYGMNDEVGLLVNSSRGILYAGSGTDFAAQARQVAKKLQKEMEEVLGNRGNLNGE